MLDRFKRKIKTIQYEHKLKAVLAKSSYEELMITKKVVLAEIEKRKKTEGVH